LLSSLQRSSSKGRRRSREGTEGKGRDGEGNGHSTSRSSSRRRQPAVIMIFTGPGCWSGSCHGNASNGSGRPEIMNTRCERRSCWPQTSDNRPGEEMTVLRSLQRESSNRPWESSALLCEDGQQQSQEAVEAETQTSLPLGVNSRKDRTGHSFGDVSSAPKPEMNPWSVGHTANLDISSAN
jgi:hypothetical protein